MRAPLNVAAACVNVDCNCNGHSRNMDTRVGTVYGQGKTKKTDKIITDESNRISSRERASIGRIEARTRQKRIRYSNMQLMCCIANVRRPAIAIKDVNGDVHRSQYYIAGHSARTNANAFLHSSHLQRPDKCKYYTNIAEFDICILRAQ